MRSSFFYRIVFIFATILFFGYMLPPTPPPGAMGKYLDGIFPESVPGDGGIYALEDPFPNQDMVSPIQMANFPGKETFLILSKIGKLWEYDEATDSQKLMLDISERVFAKSDAGMLGFVFHPKFGDISFPDKQLIYVYYKTKPDADQWDDRGFSRLSVFEFDTENEVFIEESENILIQQYDRSPWHNGGKMFFGPDEFLYFAVGDEGFEEHQVASTQRLDGGFFNGIFRIDVDNDSTRSHPIRRQPIANAEAPNGWGETFSQGYMIPNDNPWMDEDGGILEEYFALGIRSPYGFSYDEITDKFWLTDVGSNVVEEISWFQKGDNMQWPYMEGSEESEVHSRPANLIGNERPYFYEYPRSFGTCIVGATLYRGGNFQSLYGNLLFADFTSDKLMSLSDFENPDGPTLSVLLNSLNGMDLNLPESPGFTSVDAMDDGRIFLGVIGEDHFSKGRVIELVSREAVPEPPSKLSDLGVFTDMESLTVRNGIIPYTVNAPLWSDGAEKRRWVALPNDGTLDQDDEKITFRSHEEWDFPEGTVFIKHFELPRDLNTGEVTKIETRFFIIGKDGARYGVTYKWNEEGTEAYLLTVDDERDIDIYDGDEYLYTQTWKYPSRDQCMTCHTDNANSILGVNTHQLNGKLYYNHLNEERNQLNYLNDIGAFKSDIVSALRYPRSHNVRNNSTDLKTKIRSYLDSNCASCHRPGGLPTTSLDFRFSQTVTLEKYFNYDSESHASTPNSKIILPGDHSASEIWVRDSSVDDNKMPPIGRDFVDQVYVDSLAKWIDDIDPDGINTFHEVLVYPNPTTDFVVIQLNDSWTMPVNVSLTSISGRPVRYFDTEDRFRSIDMRNYPKGTYLLRIKDGDKEKINKIIYQ